MCRFLTLEQATVLALFYITLYGILRTDRIICSPAASVTALWYVITVPIRNIQNMCTLLISTESALPHMSTAEFIHEREHDSDHTALPTELDSSGSKLVYLYLRTVDEATIEELQATLDMHQLALFPVLDTLQSADLVDRSGLTYTTTA